VLAAISHDLRTPITAARLRAEIDDTNVRDAIVRSLMEMQYITEATLSFARDETVSEELRTIDLASLVEAVADDLMSAGQNITVAEHDRLQYRCRPALLRRALTNLMDNATKYGKRARVVLHLTKEHARIMIDDLPRISLRRCLSRSCASIIRAAARQEASALACRLPAPSSAPMAAK
jgi:signal transduction histidine kinase